jgi:hypothetical protein
MAIISRQIGWRNEENLIYELIKQTSLITSVYTSGQPAFNTGMSKQIGWSNKSKLYYEWLKEIAKWRAIAANCCPATTTTTTVAP